MYVACISRDIEAISNFSNDTIHYLFDSICIYLMLKKKAPENSGILIVVSQLNFNVTLQLVLNLFFSKTGNQDTKTRKIWGPKQVLAVSILPVSSLESNSLELTPWKGKVRTKLFSIGKLERKLISIDVRLFAKTGTCDGTFCYAYPRGGRGRGGGGGLRG